ncbi:FG-GAP repeat protein [Actinomadura craniellae]|uniref:FG-GAP repeat protein n=1 Tax=Actinomadura craniellae TaxID=2231787 RepID=UPI00131471BD|nr:FG-GAP repeat protein [Actinomadura craniellae]
MNAATPAAPGDFNGDDIIDVAIGIPSQTIGGDVRAGAVVIARGRSGAPPNSGQYIHQDLPDVPGVAEPSDGYGEVLASADFDSDGYADLAMGVSQKNIGGFSNAGGLVVCYGSATGLSVTRCSAITQDSGSVFGGSEAEDHFGYSLAAGDLTGDGYADLVIGAPLEGIGTQHDAGAVKIVKGGASGLSGAIDLTQDSPNVPSSAEAGDRFGESLAVGDIDDDGHNDLVVGVNSEQIAGSSARGALNVLYGPFTDRPARGQVVDAADVPGAGEFLGTTLALGDFNGDDYTDIATGMGEQIVSGAGFAGQVAVFTGDRTGVSAGRVRTMHQDSPYVADGVEPEDAFGSAVAAGDFDGDGRDDLLVGIRGEDLGTTPATGAAQVFFGDPAKTITGAAQVWIHQDQPPVPSVNWAGDHFGWAVAAADVDGDGKDEALIGGPVNDDGAVWIVHLDGRALASSTLFGRAELGLTAGVRGDFFGQSLAP